MNPESKICQSCKKEFAIEAEDFAFYERMKVPSPTFCSRCRTQRRFAFLTDRAFYKRKCDATGEMIFSHFSPQAPVKVYEHDYWWSDKWDPMSYGRDYDFTKSFFEQFKALTKEVPLSSRSIINLVRSDYSDHADNLKDCYLVFYASYIENTSYGTQIIECKDSIDVDDSSRCELSYNVLLAGKCYRAVNVVNCADCQDIWFSRDCVGCHDCFGCANLRNKAFCIFNEQYTKEGYEQKIKELNPGSFTAFERARGMADDFSKKLPYRYMRGTHNTMVSGDYIYHAKQTKNSYIVAETENCRYCQLITSTKDSYDYSNWGGGAELLYECAECGIDVRNLKSCFDCWPGSHDLEYCIQCHSSSDLFGCIGLRNKKYCIFNKQYAKEEYEKLVSQIRIQMRTLLYRDVAGHSYGYGEFFPPEFSPYSYQETKANIFYPLSEVDAQAKGIHWYTIVKNKHEPTMTWNKLPDHSNDIDDGIMKEIITCSHCNDCCGGVFRITRAELQIYKRLGVPLPRLCPDCRFKERIANRNPIALWKRKCQCAGGADDRGVYKNTGAHTHSSDHCLNEFETSYAPDRPEIVYCESCYQSEVI